MELFAVHEGAVGRTEVLDDVALVAAEESGMPAGSISVLHQPDLGVLRAPGDQLAVDSKGRACRQIEALLDGQAAVGPPWALRHGRREHHALLADLDVARR